MELGTGISCFSDMLFTKTLGSYAVVLFAYFNYSVQKVEISSSSDPCMNKQIWLVYP